MEQTCNQDGFAEMSFVSKKQVQVVCLLTYNEHQFERKIPVAVAVISFWLVST